MSSDSGSDMVLCDCFSLTEALADCGQRGEDRAVPLDGPYDDSSFYLGPPIVVDNLRFQD